MSKEMISSRPYEKRDYEKIMAFLGRLYALNKSQHSWLPARWEYAEFLISPMYTALGRPDWKDSIRIWQDEKSGTARIVGVVNSENPDRNVYIQIDPSYRFLEESMVKWAKEHMAWPVQGSKGKDGPKKIAIWAHDDDFHRRAILAREGFEETSDCDTETRLSLDGELPYPELPSGWHICAVSSGVDIQKRGEAVATAFNPSVTNEEIQNQIRAYLHMRTAPSYRDDLDLVAVSNDGHIGSVATIWFDAENLTGYVEPCATNRDHQRKGLGKAVVLEGLRRFKDLGGRVAYVNPFGDWRTSFYKAIGFEPYAVCRRWEATV